MKYNNTIGSFIEYVLYKANIENSGFKFIENYSDIKRLIFIMDNQEYTIRMWNIYEDGEVEYTLYKRVENHGEDVDRGVYYLT